MLTRESAQEQLQKINNQSYADELFAEAKILSGPIREAASTLLGRDEQGEAAEDWYKVRARACAILDKATAKERRKLFQILLGDAATGTELAWNYFPRLT